MPSRGGGRARAALFGNPRSPLKGVSELPITLATRASKLARKRSLEKVARLGHRLACSRITSCRGHAHIWRQPRDAIAA
jgi:hypothetical protein